MKDIKLRIKSVESTMQITKAMELVASSKLRRAKLRASRRALFHDAASDADGHRYGNTDFTSPYVQQREVKKTLLCDDRRRPGLAGGYNANLFRAVAEHMDGKAVCAAHRQKGGGILSSAAGWRPSDRGLRSGRDVQLDDCFAMARYSAGVSARASLTSWIL
ncbi:MAG: FoF1 ATP synthase subunit gamma [Ruthenibacterium lactatiformans]